MNDENVLFERYYDVVLRQIMWGDSCEEAIQRLEVNSVPVNLSKRIVQTAWKERVSSIRAIFWKKLILGGLLFSIGALLTIGVYHLSEGYKVWSFKALFIPLAPAAYGFWKMMEGFAGIITAGSMTGPVSDIE
ncbi:hypothetical protein HW115_18740 [Verrucomicrobiaceae bacterium N1E253]|uniref:Uncharacterized protein n=1 Tax=Oceaniferula marina TaxID=2748318 RepID=A0A851GKT9_9BACT|nr:hypothetical protein [Oceaniferula marina]NWK57662.1 hypothetical protein [Oceaniferula marina]